MTIESTDQLIATPAPTAERLRGLCAGAVQLPGDPGYDAARMPWNVAVDQRPAAVAFPADADQVQQFVSELNIAPLHTSQESTEDACVRRIGPGKFSQEGVPYFVRAFGIAR